jgi:DNA-binding NtrC family response regulator
MYAAASVLLVDDDDALIGVLAELLQFKGFGVSTADNGVRGYTAYLRQPTEFVITDIEMPELNGIEMMRCIRAINPAVKAVYMSGSCDRFRAELQVEEKQFSATLLPKPFSRGDLLTVMAGAPKQRPRQQRVFSIGNQISKKNI